MNKNIFAVDIGGSKLLCGILTSDGTILKTWRAEYAPGYTPDMLFDLIRQGYNALGAQNCYACGVAIPGLCDVSTGTWTYSPFSGIENVPVCDMLKSMTGLPSYADNDVNISALAEKYFGVCQNVRDFLWITVSNGIGGGLFLDGKLYRGAGLTAGEIGHVIVEDNNGRACVCGSRGCLEAMASGASISAIYQERTGKVLSTRELSELAENNDEQALKIFNEAGYYIGKAAAHAVNILGLDTVVLGGGVAQSFHLLENGAKQALDKYVFKRANPNVKLLRSGPGKHAALLGCAALVLEQKNI